MKQFFLLLGTICLIFEEKWHFFIEKFCKLWGYLPKSKEKLKYWRREDYKCLKLSVKNIEIPVN